MRQHPPVVLNDESVKMPQHPAVLLNDESAREPRRALKS